MLNGAKKSKNILGHWPYEKDDKRIFISTFVVIVINYMERTVDGKKEREECV